MPRDACCWRRRARTEPESPVYTKETICAPKQTAEEDASGNDKKNGEKNNGKKNKAAVQEQKNEKQNDDSGNPRNKTALQPGHSLMDWIRLGQSGRDLTGVGSKAGTLKITPRQLAEHCTEENAWIAIRGKVYNVTAYLPFHPGGKEELMKGAGKDATQMFNEVHAWVNYESILQKCLIGRLSALEANMDPEALFRDTDSTTLRLNSGLQLVSQVYPVDSVSEVVEQPRFDWIQKTDNITVIFYTKGLCNPEVKITVPTKESNVDIIFKYENYIFTNSLQLSQNIHWPCNVKIHHESGKVEITFKKILYKIWDNYGALTQTITEVPQEPDDARIKYIVLRKAKENYNSCLLTLQRSDGIKQIIPLGYHVKIYHQTDDELVVRAYTPVPSKFMRQCASDCTYSGDVCILVKKYTDGNMSQYICGKNKGDIMELSPPKGHFSLKSFENRDLFLMIAGGTGITPMLSLLGFILERRQRKCQRLALLFFNRTEADILCRDHLENLAKDDNRVILKHCLSNPLKEWPGHRGHITSSILRETIDEICNDTSSFPTDIYPVLCGPPLFLDLSKSLLEEIGYSPENMLLFHG